MIRSRKAIALAAVVVVLSSGGCSDDPKPKIAPPESSSPSMSKSPSAAETSMAPRDEQAAFIEEYFAAISDAISTGDPSPFLALSSDRCRNCRVIADNLVNAYADGGRIRGGKWRVLGMEHIRDAKLGAVWDVHVRSARERWLNGQGEPVKIVKAGNQRFGIAVASSGGSWAVRELRLN